MTVRLKSPKRILLSVPHMSGRELGYVQEAFDTNWLSTVGPNIDALEAEFSHLVGRPCLAVSSGTAALHLGLKLLGVQPGDEVVCPTLTFAASCFPVLYEKARPVFIDSESRSWNLDPQLLETFLAHRASQGRLPRAVIVVHLFGQSADLDPILAACGRYNVQVLEDAAESLGARYKGRHPGTFAPVGAFSLNGNKIITATGGGLLVSHDEALLARARHWSTQARDRDPLGVNNYVHSEVGYNYRLSNVLAGIARGQLGVLTERVAQRQAIAKRYRDALGSVPGISGMPEAPHGTHTHWLSCFLVDEARFGISATELIRRLDEANIEARPVWRPMHTQPLFAGYERIGGAVAEDINRRGICLPSSSSLTPDEQDFVIAAIQASSRAK